MDDEPHKITIYQIIVRGGFDKRYVGWFHKMQIEVEIDQDGKSITVITGPVIDQVALRGLMTKIWDLNMELISVKRNDE